MADLDHKRARNYAQFADFKGGRVPASEIKLVARSPVSAKWLVIAALFVSLIIDLAPRFHLGDSQSYLGTRWGVYIPEDRSWTYGLAAAWLTRATGQLFSMPLLQIFLSWAAFAFFAMALTKSLGLRRQMALVIIAIGCLEPLGYYWSRAFMTDSLAQSAFVFLCGVLLLRCSMALRFLLVFIAGFILISLRVVYFPAVLLSLLATAAWSAWNGRKHASAHEAGVSSRPDHRSARNWAVAAVAFLCADVTYAVVNTYVTHAHRLTANIANMQFLAGALSPLGADQLDYTPLTPAERSALLPLSYENRNGSIFAANGLVPLIRGHYTSTEAARPAMQRFVVNVVIHHPVGVAELVARQWGEYLNPALVWSYHHNGWWSGAVNAHWQTNYLPDSLIQLFEEWNVTPTPATDLPARNSPALWYLENFGAVWSLILALYATASFLLIFFVPRNYRADFLVFSAVFSIFYMSEIMISADDVITRYLMPISAPMIYLVVVLARFGVHAPAAISAATSAATSIFVNGWRKARNSANLLDRFLSRADTVRVVDRLWLPVLGLVLFAVMEWDFHRWTPHVWSGDDLTNYMAFRHHQFAGNLGQALTQNYLERFRPTFQLLMYVLFSVFGSHLGLYMAFNIGLNVASGLVMAMIAYRLSGRSKVIGALAALMTTGSRLMFYQVTQVTGILEGFGCLLFLLAVLAIVEIHAAAPRRSVRLAALAVGALWLLVFDHERYLAIVPWVAFMIWAAPGLRDTPARWRHGLPLLACAALLLNAGYKAFALRQALLVGTNMSHFAFDPRGYVDRASQGLLSIVGFNDGPEFLVGHPIVGSPLSVLSYVAAAMVLLLASIIGLQILAVWRHPARGPAPRAYFMPAAFAVLIGLLFVPPILTKWVEPRWEVEPFAVLVMIACWFAGRLAEQTRGLALGLFAALTATSLGLDHRLSGDLQSINYFSTQSAARSIKTQIVDPRRPAVIVADPATCDWAIGGGEFFDLYAPGWPHPRCVLSLDGLGADLLRANPRPAIFGLAPGDASVQDISAGAYDELEQTREVRRFDFIEQFSQGRINDPRPVQTPTGKGVLILPVGTAAGPRRSLTVVTGFAYRYDHLTAGPGDRLKFSALMVFSAPATSRAIVTVITAGGGQTVVFDKLLPVRPANGAPTAVRADIPLDRFGRDFSVVFSVLTPGSDLSAQWVAFDAPRIVHAPG